MTCCFLLTVSHMMQYTKYVHQLLSGKNVLIDFELIIPEIVDRSSRVGFLKKSF